MAKKRTIPLPKNRYIGEIEVNQDHLTIEFRRKKKVALLFICLNERYWSYICQVVKDCQKHFLPHHHVEFFLWTDINKFPEKVAEIRQRLEMEGTAAERLKKTMDLLIEVVLRYQTFPGTPAIIAEMTEKGFKFGRDQKGNTWIETAIPLDTEQRIEAAVAYGRECVSRILEGAANEIKVLEGSCTIHETEAIEWPYPTLMRYHLFLNEERLKDFDYLFYLDADMKVVQKISDEILGDGLTAAPHPGYAIDKKMIPPYEPNPESHAYIHRLGHVVPEGNTKRFYPFYAAGGFQGGKAKQFISAMKAMRTTIDKDFHKNYIPIWNDESVWNKYLWEYQRRGGNIVFLDVSYVYPDSLIKEYYEKIWGRSYEPKIITLTKPFTLSPGALSDLGMEKL